MDHTSVGSPTQRSGSTEPDVRERASAAGEQVKSSAGEVADTAKEQMQNVVSEAKTQAGRMTDDVRRRLGQEAEHQTFRAADLVRKWAEDLESMARGTDSDSPARTAVQRVSEQGKDLAERLQQRSPEDLMADVRRFARRKPGTFLMGAAVAGFVVGRVAKGWSGAGEDSSSTEYHAQDATGYRQTGDLTEWSSMPPVSPTAPTSPMPAVPAPPPAAEPPVAVYPGPSVATTPVEEPGPRPYPPTGGSTGPTGGTR